MNVFNVAKLVLINSLAVIYAGMTSLMVSISASTNGGVAAVQLSGRFADASPKNNRVSSVVVSPSSAVAVFASDSSCAVNSSILVTTAASSVAIGEANADPAVREALICLTCSFSESKLFGGNVGFIFVYVKTK